MSGLPGLARGFRIALMRRREKTVQLSFEDRRQRKKDGTLRKKPGPKPAERPNVRHRTRPEHAWTHPMHITMHAERGLPSFRRETLYAAFERAFRTTRRDDFRIVEFSVQTNHVHLIVEADDNDALARGMKSFSVRANRLFNAATGRMRGRVWGDRYHRRELTNGRQVRNALVYCLANDKKHFRVTHGRPRIDPCSSARWFEGWISIRERDDGERPTPGARTTLLKRAWHRHGFIHPGEFPRLAG